MPAPGYNSIVAYWAHDEVSGDRYDSHILGLTMSDTGVVPSSASGLINRGSYFQGNPDRLTRAYNSALIPSGSFSWIAWVYIEDLTNINEVLTTSTGSANYRLYVDSETGYATLDVIVNETLVSVAASSSDQVGESAWYMIYFEVVPSNHIGISVNGGTMDTQSISYAMTTDSLPLWFGANQSSTNWFIGIMDETVMFNRILTSSEISWMYNTGSGRSYTETAAVNHLTATGISTTPVVSTPSIGVLLGATGFLVNPTLKTPVLIDVAYTYLIDKFDEVSDTDLTSHSPDTNNTGNSWQNVASLNPAEVVGGGLGGDGVARSKYISGYTTGYGAIDIGDTVNNLDISTIMQGYAAAYSCYLYFGSDSTFQNGWRVSWNCAGSLFLHEIISGSPTSRGSATPAAAGGSAKRTIVVKLSGSNVDVDFNNGEATISYGSYSPDGQYVGFAVDRKDSGYHRIFDLRVTSSVIPGTDILTATGISTTPEASNSSIGQTHILSSIGTSSTPIVGTPSITGEHALFSSGLLVNPSNGIPIFSAIINLTASSLVCSVPVLGTPTAEDLPTSHLLSSGFSTPEPVSGTPGLVHSPIRVYPFVPAPPSIDTPVYILDPDDLSIMGIIEDYYSLNWTERYNEMGEFELEVPIEYDEHPLLAFNNFLYIKSSERLMIIEDIKPTQEEDRAFLLVKGSSAESLLTRRILIGGINVSGLAENLVYFLVDSNMVDADDADRNISIIKTTYPSPATSIQYKNQLEMQSLYDAVEKICKTTNLGFKFIRENIAGSGEIPITKLGFYVYNGEDRSFDQSTNTYVIFSDNFDNVVSSSFYLSQKKKINIVLVSTDLKDKYGEDENSETLDKVFVWYGPEPSGINRYETILETEISRTIEPWPIPEEPEPPAVFNHPDPVLGRPGYHLLDAAGIEVKIEMAVNWNEPDPDPEPPETPLTDTEVLDIISTRGSEILDTWKSVGLFEGDFDIYGNFKYGIDFFMGDIVQCNIEGRNVKARIIELVRSYSTEGVKSYVAFDFVI